VLGTLTDIVALSGLTDWALLATAEPSKNGKTRRSIEDNWYRIGQNTAYEVLAHILVLPKRKTGWPPTIFTELHLPLVPTPLVGVAKP
jgi:hypothetical protein